MDVFLTVVAGVAVFVFGQAVMKFLVEPWHEYRTLVGRIAHAVILYSNATDNPMVASPTPVDEARRELRSLAGHLWQRTYAIPLYGPLSRVCWWMPTREEIPKASGALIGLSNSMSGATGRYEYVADVRKGLHLYDPSAAPPVRRPLRARIGERFRRLAP